MAKRSTHRPSYRSVQAWQEATGTTNRRLAAQIGCTETHLSNILKKSRRCSLALAIRLAKVTSVPLDSIAEWPPEYEEFVR